LPHPTPIFIIFRLLLRPPPSPLFPYTTLFRSWIPGKHCLSICRSSSKIYFLWIQRSLRIVTHSLVFAGLHATLVTNTISRSSWSSSLIFRFGNTSKKSFSILFSFLLFVPVKKFFSQRIKKLFLRHLLHYFTSLDQKTYAVAACNAAIRFFRFSRTVHNTSQDGHLDIQRDIKVAVMGCVVN